MNRQAIAQAMPATESSFCAFCAFSRLRNQIAAKRHRRRKKATSAETFVGDSSQGAKILKVSSAKTPRRIEPVRISWRLGVLAVRIIPDPFSFVIAVFLASTVHAAGMNRQQQVEVLNQALRAFDQAVESRPRQPEEARKGFADAAARFQTLVDAGVRNGRLYYDLGNAYLQAGRLGEAVVNYRRAERLIPGDARLQENLRYARSLCQTQIPVSGQRAFVQTLFFWHHDTPLRSRMIVALVTYAIFWFGLVGWTYKRRAAWWYVLAPALAVWLAAGTSVFVELYHPPATVGVIVADNVTVQKGNGEGFEPQFQEKLHAGVEFTLLERRGDWLNIELGDGKNGWVRVADAELI